MLIWACFRHCVYQYRVVGTSVISGAFTTECSLEHLRAHSKSQLEAAVWAADSRSEAGQGCLPHRDGSGFCVKAVRGPTDVRPKTSFWGDLEALLGVIQRPPWPVGKVTFLAFDSDPGQSK